MKWIADMLANSNTQPMLSKRVLPHKRLAPFDLRSSWSKVPFSFLFLFSFRQAKENRRVENLSVNIVILPAASLPHIVSYRQLRIR